jgi:hypothetical protein
LVLAVVEAQHQEHLVLLEATLLSVRLHLYKEAVQAVVEDPLQIVWVEMVVLVEVDLTVLMVDLELLDKVILVVIPVALLVVAAVEEKMVLETQQQV